MSKTRHTPPEIALLDAMIGRYPLVWFIAYTRVQAERRAFKALMEAGVLTWLPEQIVHRRQPRTKRKYPVRLPIFSRYLFVGLDRLQQQTIADVHACDGVEGLVKSSVNADPLPLCADKLRELIRRIYDAERICDGDVFKLGSDVRIVSGAFNGHTLKVDSVDHHAGSVTGCVSVFGRPTPVTVPVDDVKALA